MSNSSHTLAIGSQGRQNERLMQAARLLERNTRDFGDFRAAVPSPESYPFYWPGWDSAKHVIVLSFIDKEWAAQEARAFLACQRPDGLIPAVCLGDVATWNKPWVYLESRKIPLLRGARFTELIQPPLYAQAVEYAGGELVAEALPKLERLYRAHFDLRDPDGDGLVSIVSQFESGMDYSYVFGGRFRRDPLSMFIGARWPELANRLMGFDAGRIIRRTDRHYVDVSFNTWLIDGLRSCARMAEELNPGFADWARRQAKTSLDALIAKCWNDGAGMFFNLKGRRERMVKQPWVGGLIPLLLEELPADKAERLKAHIFNPETFGSRYAVPSIPLNDPRFRPNNRILGIRFIWTGGASLDQAWGLTIGLGRHDYTAKADRLAARTVAAFDLSGPCEFYDARTGAPVGARNFGWGTMGAIAQLWREDPAIAWRDARRLAAIV